MRCKSCGEQIPDPEPKVVVTEKIREIQINDKVYYLKMVRWAAIALICMMILISVDCLVSKYLESKTLEKIITDPRATFEIRENPGRSAEKVWRRDPEKK